MDLDFVVRHHGNNPTAWEEVHDLMQMPPEFTQLPDRPPKKRKRSASGGEGSEKEAHNPVEGSPKRTPFPGDRSKKRKQFAGSGEGSRDAPYIMPSSSEPKGEGVGDRADDDGSSENEDKGEDKDDDPVRGGSEWSSDSDSAESCIEVVPLPYYTKPSGYESGHEADEDNVHGGVTVKNEDEDDDPVRSGSAESEWSSDSAESCIEVVPLKYCEESSGYDSESGCDGDEGSGQGGKNSEVLVDEEDDRADGGGNDTASSPVLVPPEPSLGESRVSRRTVPGSHYLLESSAVVVAHAHHVVPAHLEVPRPLPPRKQDARNAVLVGKLSHVCAWPAWIHYSWNPWLRL